jgi:hypothetical protein
MAADDATDLLDDAIEEAKAKGYPAKGWILMSEDIGYSAWLFIEDADGDAESIGTICEACPTPLQAAKAALEDVRALPLNDEN